MSLSKIQALVQGAIDEIDTTLEKNNKKEEELQKERVAVIEGIKKRMLNTIFEIFHEKHTKETN